MSSRPEVSTPDPEHYGSLGSSLTLNLTVRDIGAVISLLTDAGYEVDVNVARPGEPRQVPSPKETS